jgi:hypothetical protein
MIGDASVCFEELGGFGGSVLDIVLPRYIVYMSMADALLVVL